ncbi:hypothetical protein CEXT_299711 [Caerostris extrusa]|uniref:Uncharacterized protein n=1 Tax=Caerostris extrusa TaxID=172846 RepID=A0AAV4PWP0_CAEEX|nr:hypothetical protein CEXT_299711 [Caerostris extrusa]
MLNTICLTLDTTAQLMEFPLAGLTYSSIMDIKSFRTIFYLVSPAPEIGWKINMRFDIRNELQFQAYDIGNNSLLCHQFGSSYCRRMILSRFMD